MGIYMRMLNWSKGGFFLVLDINIVVVRMVKEGGTRETRVSKAVVLVIRDLCCGGLCIISEEQSLVI